MFFVPKNACQGQAPEPPKGAAMADEKRKTGRPKKAPAEARTERLSAPTFTAAERGYVELMAERAGLSVMEFCRRSILGQRVAARRQRRDDALLLELNRIGVNINQIAHGVNAGRGLPHDMPEVMAELRAILNKLAGAADGA